MDGWTAIKFGSVIHVPLRKEFEKFLPLHREVTEYDILLKSQAGLKPLCHQADQSICSFNSISQTFERKGNVEIQKYQNIWGLEKCIPLG